MKKLSIITTIGLGLILSMSGWHATFHKTFQDDSMALKRIIDMDSVKTNCCNAPTYELYPEAVVLWHQTWSYLNGTSFGDGVRTIKASLLKELYERHEESSSGEHGLRIYYGLQNENDSIPELLLINTINCEDVYHDGGLTLVTADTIQTVSKKRAMELTKRWQSRTTKTERTDVYAYNYNWDQLKDLSGGQWQEDIRIVYGIRTLSPEESQSMFESAQNLQTAQKFGSIVYVNVLFIEETFDRFSNNDGDPFDDFSRPCPKFCDPDSDLVLQTF